MEKGKQKKETQKKNLFYILKTLTFGEFFFLFNMIT